MSKKGKKIPQLAMARRPEKDVRTPNVETDPHPSWRFSTVDKGGPFIWPKGRQEELEIVVKLHDFDSMKWSEIEGRDHHLLNADSISKEALNRLQEIKQEDNIDSIFSFHLNGMTRIVCIKDRNIAKLLWYDPNHKVCPPVKR